MQERYEADEAIRFPYPRLRPWLLAFIVGLFAFMIFAFFMDQGRLSGRFVIFTLVVVGCLLALLAVIRPQRYVEVSGDLLTNYNRIRRRIRWSPPLFRLILPKLLNNPDVYMAPEVRAGLTRHIAG